MQKTRLLSAAFFCAITLTACTPFSPLPTEEMSVYTLSDEVNAPTDARVIQKKLNAIIVVVHPMQAAAGFNSSDMIYMKQNYQIQHFTKNRWVAPPAQLISPLVVQSLQNSPYLHIVEPPYTGSMGAQLGLTLVSLQQNFTPTECHVQLQIRAQLTDVRHLENARVHTHFFTAMKPCTADSPYGGVVAANEALQEILKELPPFVVKSLQK